jgi:RNA polymerase sigma-70 factor, ECF subfamily
MRSKTTRLSGDGYEEARIRTRKVLKSLPPHLRKILVLREIEQLPMEEVAARLGLSRAAAERRWTRAIGLMTKRLAKIRPRNDGT